VSGRAAAVGDLVGLLARVRRQSRGGKADPLAATAKKLGRAVVERIDAEAASEMADVAAVALDEAVQ
jgi:hypothetical protein